MVIHIGEKIRRRAKELRIGPTELGQLINTSKQNVHSIFKRKSIDAAMLLKISEVLKEDFFQYYNEHLSFLEEDPYYFTRKEIIALKKRYDYLMEENARLKRENESLKEKTALLEQIAELKKRGKTGG